MKNINWKKFNQKRKKYTARFANWVDEEWNSFWMIRSEREFHSSVFRCIGVAFFIDEYFPNVTRQAMKVLVIKSIPLLGLHGSSNFTIDHSLYSSGCHGKSISIHSFPSCFCLYPLFPACTKGQEFNIRISQYIYNLHAWFYNIEHRSNLPSIWRDRVKFRN